MRWIYRGVAFLFTLGFLALVALALIPGQKLADLASERLKIVTGRDVQIEGDVTTSLFPHLSITTGPVKLANADWSESGPMITAEGLKVGVSFFSLLSGDVVIKTVEFNQPKILLEITEDGRENWSFDEKTIQVVKAPSSNEGGSEKVATSRSYSVDEAAVKGADIRFIDHQNGRQERFQNVDFTLRMPDADGAIKVVGSGEYSGAVVKMGATVTNARNFIDGLVTPLEISAEYGGVKASFDGKLGLGNFEFDGQLSAHANDLPAFSARFGGAGGVFDGAFALSGKATRTDDGALFLRSGRIAIGENEVRGDVDLLPGKDRPKLKAALTADVLDFSETSKSRNSQGKPQSARPKKPKTQTGWPKDQISTDFLFLTDAEVSLRANKLVLGGLKLGKSQILTRVEAGRAVFALEQTAAYDGALSGQFVMNGRGGLSVGGNLAAANVDVEPLLIDLVDLERFSGKGDFSIEFLGVGESVDEIMHNFSGSAQLAMRKGALKGVDLKRMIANTDPDQQGDGKRTIFDSLTASFDIENGIARTDDLDVRANGLTAVGTGEVDLGEQMLDFRVVPTALVKEDGTGGVKVPVRIKGPWAGPRYFLDVEALNAKDLDIDQEDLEKKVKKARKKVKNDIAKKLGIKQKKGESLEDAARRTIEETATKELMKILGGGN
ncbi:AsmA family protein [Halocynthiibacter sp. C4]|uniref:AsmA family protein n=1 Tax=Halocynthiibacter sp. C4 TaxID=2992758 RepID=UPI00237BE389|nr:AsmA family protein [Halocynthiibacter sp. C4]MDE0588750.1 AsmA family protein [Halocynthiibacter sp. C4]